jgi:hypothetical protein
VFIQQWPTLCMWRTFQLYMTDRNYRDHFVVWHSVEFIQ